MKTIICRRYGESEVLELAKVPDRKYAHRGGQYREVGLSPIKLSDQMTIGEYRNRPVSRIMTASSSCMEAHSSSGVP